MSWGAILGALAKAGKAAGSYAAKNPSTIAGLAQLGTSIAGNRAKGREEETALGFQGDRNATDLYGIEQNAALRAAELTDRGALDRADLDLKRKGFALEAPKSRANLAVLGDLLANMQDVTVPDHPRANVVRFEGGLRPSNLSPETRAMGTDLRRTAIMNQLAGDQFADVPTTDFTGTLRKPPVPTDVPKATGMDRFLDTSSMIAAAIAAIQQGQQDKTQLVGTKPPARTNPEWAALPRPWKNVVF